MILELINFLQRGVAFHRIASVNRLLEIGPRGRLLVVQIFVNLMIGVLFEITRHPHLQVQFFKYLVFVEVILQTARMGCRRFGGDIRFNALNRLRLSIRTGNGHRAGIDPAAGDGTVAPAVVSDTKAGALVQRGIALRRDVIAILSEHGFAALRRRVIAQPQIGVHAGGTADGKTIAFVF